MIFRSRDAVLTLLMAGALCAPATLPGQASPTARVHVVRPGETLWRIATDYLGDGHRWREIVAANAKVVSRERFVKVGTRLVIPGARPAKPGVASRRAEGRTERPTAAAAVRPPAARPPSEAPVPANATSAEPTVFARGTPSTTVARPTMTAPPREARASNGLDALRREQLSAPWFDDGDVASSAGRVGRRIEAAAFGRADTMRGLHLFDRLLLTPPRGVPVDTTARFLAVALEEPTGSLGRLVTPLALIRVVRTAGEDGMTEGIVTATFGALESGAILVPVPSSGLGEAETQATGERPTVDGRVVAVVGGAALPTLQHVVMLDAGTTLGVRPGDPVSFYADEAARATAGHEMARGVVLRVTARGASALIVRQSQAQLGEGTRARIGKSLP